eukprot:2384212-Lingulodinium_polyedra.AAC.1
MFKSWSRSVPCNRPAIPQRVGSAMDPPASAYFHRRVWGQQGQVVQPSSGSLLRRSCAPWLSQAW